MSNQALTWAFHRDVKPAGRKFVLVALADFADENNSCFPSIDRLAAMTGQSDKSVRDHLNALEAEGLLSRHRDRRSDGTLTGYRYILPVDESARKISPTTTGKSRSSHRQVSPPPPASLATTTGEICRSITPNNNPQVEPSFDGEFSEWYEQYPRKAQRAKAEKAYRQARKRTTAENLLDGVKRYAAWCRSSPATESQFIRHPATWLNGDGWDDELAPKDGKPAPVVVPVSGVPIRPNTPQARAWLDHFAPLKATDRKAAIAWSMLNQDRTIHMETEWPSGFTPRMEAAE